MTYEIKNVDELEQSAADLANSNQKVSSDAASLVYIIKEIKANWQNEAGTDLASIISELERCTNKLQQAINPTLAKYIETMNSLVIESRTTQNQSM